MRGRALQERHSWRMFRSFQRGPTKIPQGAGQWPSLLATWMRGTMSWCSPHESRCAVTSTLLTVQSINHCEAV